MKNVLMMIVLLAAPSVFAQKAIDAPAYLENQDPASCFMKRVMNHFIAEKLRDQPNATPPKPVAFNFNGETDVSAIQESSRFDGITVQTKQRGYNVRIRQFGSGLGAGSQLDFVLNSETCKPAKIYQTCGNNIYIEVKLVGDKCQVASPWSKKKKKGAMKEDCAITQSMCCFLDPAREGCKTETETTEGSN